tara:strand:+ start:189 stop:1841 length:1653 start_codon:yes stop_codon:yes gene_type:complete
MSGLTNELIKPIIASYNNGQIQETIDAIKILNKDYPNVPLLFNILGACYKSLGQLETSLNFFETALKIKPDYAEANFNLGVIHQELFQFDSAIISYNKAIAAMVNYPDAYNNLGIIFLNSNKLDKAIEYFEWAIAYKNDFAEAHNNLGSTLQKLEKLDDATKSYEKAIKLKPDFAQAHNNIGILFQKLGKVDSAQLSYEMAITHEPTNASAHYNLSVIKKYSANDPQINQMQLLLSSDRINQSDRTYLNFSLAKVNEDLGKEDDFISYLNEGNRLRKEELNYFSENSDNDNIIIKNLFNSRSTLIKNIPDESSTIKPIFIIGMPRSGTTLVEQIISSHNEVYGSGELKTLNSIIIKLIQDNSSFEKIELSKKNILSIRHQYFDSLRSFNVSENIFTDKWPLNFRNVGFILSAFPDAKIIHLKRDAKATCWSIYKHYFSDNGNGWAYNLDDIVKFYKSYSDLMDYWHNLNPTKIYDICYEDLTINQEEETRKLLKYCELDWDENCLNFHTNTRAVKTASAVQIRKPMYQGSSDEWKKYESYLQSLVQEFDS